MPRLKEELLRVHGGQDLPYIPPRRETRRFSSPSGEQFFFDEQKKHYLSTLIGGRCARAILDLNDNWDDLKEYRLVAGIQEPYSTPRGMRDARDIADTLVEKEREMTDIAGDISEYCNELIQDLAGLFRG
jgi:hypothetical protein|tara:strand:+ start:1894 stop:2283 length:390 start_codon:yes stop_codon:yes gene_type:complete